MSRGSRVELGAAKVNTNIDVHILPTYEELYAMVATHATRRGVERSGEAATSVVYR